MSVKPKMTKCVDCPAEISARGNRKRCLDCQDKEYCRQRSARLKKKRTKLQAVSA